MNQIDIPLHNDLNLDSCYESISDLDEEYEDCTFTENIAIIPEVMNTTDYDDEVKYSEEIMEPISNDIYTLPGKERIVFKSQKKKIKLDLKNPKENPTKDGVFPKLISPNGFSNTKPIDETVAQLLLIMQNNNKNPTEEER